MPHTQDGLPFQGATRRSAHASYTGAVSASQTRSANLTALRQLWREPRTMVEMSTISGLPLSSICSLKACLANELEVVDFEDIHWGDGRKATKRTRWRIRR
jgi:hypothetical protein